jgi:hypothetical protein
MFMYYKEQISKLIWLPIGISSISIGFLVKVYIIFFQLVHKVNYIGTFDNRHDGI